MQNIKDQSLSIIELKNVLLRLDLNVPLNNGKVIDDTRIHKIIDTIIFLLQNNAKIVIISHVGRPKGKFDEKLSLKPIAERLEYILKKSPDIEHIYGRTVHPHALLRRFINRLCEAIIHDDLS